MFNFCIFLVFCYVLCVAVGCMRLTGDELDKESLHWKIKPIMESHVPLSGCWL